MSAVFGVCDVLYILCALFRGFPARVDSSYFRYHLKDVIVGKIFFLLVRIKIKHMELAILKRESTGSGLHPMLG